MTVKTAPTQTRSGSGPSDAALVVAARAGERWAQEALFRRYSRMVNGLAYRVMGREQDIDDLVQESFIQALRGLDRLEDPQAFKSWLGAIVIRTAHKTIRHRSMLARLKIRPAPTADLDAVAAHASNPETAAELRAVYGCLESLKPEPRIALLLHRVEGMSIPEVAAHMGLSESTVKRRLAVAERRLSAYARGES